MYISSEVTFSQAGVGGPGFGQLVASAALQSITVIVTTLTTVSGTPVATLNLDLLLGDNQNANLNPNTDTSWASNALLTGITVPLTAGQSASASFTGCYRGARANVPVWGTPGTTPAAGSFKVQISARDMA